MNLSTFREMSVAELWSIHKQIQGILSSKLLEHQIRLEEELRDLKAVAVPLLGASRRPYPRVFPKFRNPIEPSQTWSGRGKKPRWVLDQLKRGKRLDDFRISTL
jgi:DNA-binding protein H-NS